MTRFIAKWVFIALVTWLILVLADGVFTGLIVACMSISADLLPADLDLAGAWFLFGLVTMAAYVGIYAASLVAWLWKFRRLAWAIAGAAAIWSAMVLLGDGDEWAVAGALAGALTFAVGADAARRALAISVTPVEFVAAWWELSNGIPFSSQAQLTRPIYSASNQFGSARLIRAKAFHADVEKHFEGAFR